MISNKHSFAFALQGLFIFRLTPFCLISQHLIQSPAGNNTSARVGHGGQIRAPQLCHLDATSTQLGERGKPHERPVSVSTRPPPPQTAGLKTAGMYFLIVPDLSTSPGSRCWPIESLIRTLPGEQASTSSLCSHTAFPLCWGR